MLEQSIFIPHATAQAIYAILLDSQKHGELTGGKAAIDPKVGGAFTTYGGYATGRNTKLVPSKLIEQTWRASDWLENHYSKIRFSLEDVEGGAEIHFVQKDLPAGAEEEFRRGWQDFYWTPLKKYFRLH